MRSGMRLAVFSLGLLFFPGSLTLSPARPDRQLFERSLFHAAELRSRGEFGQSFEALQQALTLVRGHRDPSRQGRCLMRMGLLKWDLGEIGGSAYHFGEAATAFRKAGDLRALEFCAKCLEVIRLYNQGKDDRTAGLLHSSVARFEEASLRGRETGIPDFELKCLRQESLAYLDLRQFDLFLKNNKKGLEIAADIRHGIEQGRCLNNIGVYYQWQNDYSRAVVFFEKALAVLSAVADPATEAECQNNLGLIYRELGNFERAQFYLASALDRDRRAGDLSAIAMDLANIGAVLLSRGIVEHRKEDLLKAFDLFQECLRLQDRRNTGHLITFSALNNMGIILNELEDREGARRHFSRAMNILDPSKNILESCHAMSNIATTYLDEQNIDEALSHFRKAFDLSIKSSFDNALIESSVGLGQCYERKGDGLTALSFYRRAMDTIETLRGRVSSESAMIGFARNKLEPYERLIYILADLYVSRPSRGGLNEIFSIFEKARARAFLKSVQAARFDLPSSGYSLLAERQQTLSRNIANLFDAVADPSHTPESRQALKDELELEEEEYVRSIQEARAAGQVRGNRRPDAIDRVETVQELLIDRKALLMEYFLGEKRSYLISISSTTASLHLLPKRQDIEASLRAYLKLIADRSLEPKAGFEAAARIGQLLIPAEMEEELKSTRTIIVVPDGILHYLPFETLRIPYGTGLSYLVEEASVAYCPSSSALIALMGPDRLPPSQWKKELLAVGGSIYQPKDGHDEGAPVKGHPVDKPIDFEEGIELRPLPFSRKEILDISKVFRPDAVDLLVGEDANEANVKAWPLTNYRIIHFACHGFLNVRYPFRSALVLSPGGNAEEDGFLQMREIYGLDVSADLVVLSACQTGNGLMERSEGTLGLSRPFFFAGARSVLASLWPIDDEATGAFMSDLYRAIAEGSSTAEALRHTKRKMLKSRWAHPYYWATFLLQGDPFVSGLMN
jgi:CHAT domain-containing protein/Tfp pilus assembly protein PilF